ncbi:MAG: hypothetical protein ACLVI4_01045 [Anaerovoracaceae bacterium]
MNLQDRGEKTADITVSVDVSKIVRNVSIAGVLVVGIIFGCSTCRKILQDKKIDQDLQKRKVCRYQGIAFRFFHRYFL